MKGCSGCDAVAVNIKKKILCKYIACKDNIRMIILCVMLTSFLVNDGRMNVLLKISSKRKQQRI